MENPLSMVLEAVVSQQLIPTLNGSLVPAFEIMLVTPAIRNMIRDGKVHQIDSAIFSGASEGMRTMDSSLFNLYQEGKITEETAEIVFNRINKKAEDYFLRNGLRLIAKFSQQDSITD